ncbi:poly(A) polymerase [bacterium]|nr:poly(A) polymerase [bacterium]
MTETPLIVSRKEHQLSHRNIDEDALKVISRLHRHGHIAYLVGGGVRDLLLGKTPKDFDIGTSATTEEVRKLFRNSRIIGRRFPLNHVFFPGQKILEVSTFRSEAKLDSEGSDEVVETQKKTVHLTRTDNTYGTAESDALRRDLTINGLFYDPETRSVIDYVGGLEDLERGVIRMIGNPGQRFNEDPVRMIRAIRHTARTGFVIEAETYDALLGSVQLITLSATARIHEEFLRELNGGASCASFRLMRVVGLLDHLLPGLEDFWAGRGKAQWHITEEVLHRVDTLIGEGYVLSAGILLAALAIGSVDRETLRRILGAEPSDLLMQLFEQAPHPRERELHYNPDFHLELDSRELDEEVQLVLKGLYSRIGITRNEREEITECLKKRYLFLYEQSMLPRSPRARLLVHLVDAALAPPRAVDLIVQKTAPLRRRRRRKPHA